MSNSPISMEVEDKQIIDSLHKLIALGKNPSSVMADIATLGERSTRHRFDTETGPDGQKWKPSLRAQITGGRTLTERGHLVGSISGRHGRDFAEWGANRIYAAIHQFGGEIEKPAQTRMVRHRTDAKGNLLRSKIMNGNGLVFAKNSHKRVSIRWFIQHGHTVNMPARPFLGLSDEDSANILNIIEARIKATCAPSSA